MNENMVGNLLEKLDSAGATTKDFSERTAYVRACAPGKLYIAGEYAVVHGSAAIVAAVNRYITVVVDSENLGEDGKCCGIIDSNAKKYEPLRYMRGVDGDIEIVGEYGSKGCNSADSINVFTSVESSQCIQPYAYVLAAMRVMNAYVYEKYGQSVAARLYNLHISSELDDAESGQKYGLGSSAAVTVATVRALCQWYGLSLSTPRICKLALIASAMVKKSGSGGDVAAISYGGWILYRAYDRNWLEAELTLIQSGDSNVCLLLNKKWPRLEIKRLKVHSALKLLVGWTGSPASSAKLVSSVENGAHVSAGNSAGNSESNSAGSGLDKNFSSYTEPFTYEDFCAQSEICVQKLAKSLENFELDDIAAEFAQNRKLLRKLSVLTGTVIETQKLTQLIKDADSVGIPAKTSGAGGGDCGIALATIYEKDRIESIKSAWQNHGIKPLNIEVTKIFGTGESSENITMGKKLLQKSQLSQTSLRSSRLPQESSQSLTMQNRKDEHIALADAQYKTFACSGFDTVQFMPNALPQVALDEVNPSVCVLGSDSLPNTSHADAAPRNWRLPFYINAMTGGSLATKNINASLARVAAKTGVAIASGSLSAALRDDTLTSTFSVMRSENPNGFVMANVSAGTSADDALRAVNILQANALQVHLNAAQELVMPEGDRDFRGWMHNIEQMVSVCEAQQVPVIVKETGCGMTAKDVQRLQEVGVHTVDVGGRGGTNFVAIENARRLHGDYDYLANWGLTTVESLLDIRKCEMLKSVEIFASGGVRTPLDVVRALALGASAVGVAGEFLHTLMHQGEDELVQQITAWKEQICVIMALLGCKTVKELRENVDVRVRDIV
ncbi:type 2 isopentenyl-diphosphate Delta-isomerase [Gardnerella vaginalis]|uniref:type 2 isopentenyl-diphosphate Delta-isomerase n=1 Tax=Gardnerella vaginalis TaxID=2702 RepID=UPI0003F7D06C|nr:type 2 isopentenyl-diphosphate Delta-isomerase [Gardnerella vaginalis]